MPRRFSFRIEKNGDENWHIWEIGTDGSGLRQISDGPYTDFAPEELAGRPAGILLDADSQLQRLCANALHSSVHDEPWTAATYDRSRSTASTIIRRHAMPNGQILYTRWEYVDRDVKWRQSLWTVRPDGTNMQLYFGNTIRNPAVIWQARPIPGRDSVAATFAPHHGWPLGAIGTVTQRYGPETAPGVGFDWITHEYPEIWDNGRLTEWAYRDPFPIDDRLLLVSYGGGQSAEVDERRFRIYLLDASDVQLLLHEDVALSCIYPVPIMKRPRPPATTQQSARDTAPEGVFLLRDVYRGLGKTVPAGRNQISADFGAAAQVSRQRIEPKGVRDGPRDGPPVLLSQTVSGDRAG